MNRVGLLLACSLVACGPSVGVPVESSTSDGGSSSSSTSSDDDDDASAATTSTGSGLDTGSTSEGSSTGEAPPIELPMEMADEWICAGWDPLLIELDFDETTMEWSGTGCGPYSGEPPLFDIVHGPLEFHDPSITGTQAYWTFELDYTDFGIPVRKIAMSMDYVPETDTLEGVLDLEGSGSSPQTCQRRE